MDMRRNILPGNGRFRICGNSFLISPKTNTKRYKYKQKCKKRTNTLFSTGSVVISF